MASLNAGSRTSASGRPGMTDLKLAVIDVPPGDAAESQSGIHMMRPRIYGAYREPDTPLLPGRRVAAIVMHPASNFMGHYIIEPLAARGICTMGLNSRFAGNDSVLQMERVILDLGAGVRFLRDRGYDTVILLGNSGGAALVSFYQAEAEQPTLRTTAAGDPIAIAPDDLPPADGIVLSAAHPGRSRLMRAWIDPSVLDEQDPLAVDPDLDVYNPNNGPPFTPEFLDRFKAGQAARLDRIERWVHARLSKLRATGQAPDDQAFVIHRTHADPRLLDLSLDPNDRAPGSLWGDPRMVNYSGNAMGRYTSLKSFLSQWSSKSLADGPDNIARTRMPVLFLIFTADQSTFPSTNRLWLDAIGARATTTDITGGTHYLKGQPDLVAVVADRIAAWVAEIADQTNP